MQAEKFSYLECLSYVAQKRGVDASAEQLRRRYAHLEDDDHADAFLAIAADLGLTASKLNARWRDLPRLRRSLPAILGLRDGTAVVLEAIIDDPDSGWTVSLVAPAAGSDSKVIVDEDQLRSVWDGDLFLMKRRYRLDDESRPFSIGWIAGQVLRERRLLRDISIAAMISTTFALTPAFIAMIVIDRVLVNRSASTLWVIAGVLILMVIFEMVLTFLRNLFMQVTATRIDGRLNLYVMDKMLRLPMGYFEVNPTGMLLSKLSKVYQIRSFLTGSMFNTFLEMFTLIGLIPALIILKWQLSIFVFACATMIFVIVFLYLKPMGKRHEVMIAAERKKNSFLTETIYGMRTVKSLALEDRRRSEWDVRVADGALAAYREGTLANYPQTLTIPLMRLIYSGSIVLGAFAFLYGDNSINPGGLIAFAMLATRTASPLASLASSISQIGEIQGAVYEVASVMNTPPEDARDVSGLKLPIVGNISFEKVDFRYTPGAPLALSGVSFEIPSGTIFGIMGRSGSGKTTITRLLQGLNADYEGMIKIDGMDLREMSLHHLRTSVGVVPQENFLFSGTIRENIGIAKQDATFSQIVRAAQLAGAEEFIERMPRGYDTRLEEGASNLSGGQRQRLAIARALLIDPAVLILDEATSALDAESEAIINANLMRIASQRTIICVSHRLSMLVPSHAILVMERGKVYDIGRHEELLHRCDIYKQMWYQQNRHLDPNGTHAPYALASTAS